MVVDLGDGLMRFTAADHTDGGIVKEHAIDAGEWCHWWYEHAKTIDSARDAKKSPRYAMEVDFRTRLAEYGINLNVSQTAALMNTLIPAVVEAKKN